MWGNYPCMKSLMLMAISGKFICNVNTNIENYAGCKDSDNMILLNNKSVNNMQNVKQYNHIENYSGNNNNIGNNQSSRDDQDSCNNSDIWKYEDRNGSKLVISKYSIVPKYGIIADLESALRGFENAIWSYLYGEIPPPVIEIFEAKNENSDMQRENRILGKRARTAVQDDLIILKEEREKQEEKRGRERGARADRAAARMQRDAPPSTSISTSISTSMLPTSSVDLMGQPSSAAAAAGAASMSVPPSTTTTAVIDITTYTNIDTVTDNDIDAVVTTDNDNDRDSMKCSDDINIVVDTLLILSGSSRNNDNRNNDNNKNNNDSNNDNNRNSNNNVREKIKHREKEIDEDLGSMLGFKKAKLGEIDVISESFPSIQNIFQGDPLSHPLSTNEEIFTDFITSSAIPLGTPTELRTISSC